MLLDQTSLLSTRVDVVKFLIERDGDHCYLCPKPFERDAEDDYSDYTIDHVIPRARGGLDHVDNYKLAHFPCNQEKDDRMFLPDGTLEPKRNSRAPKVPKAEREQVCDRCMNGRMLQQGAFCDVCGHESGPQKWPWWARRAANECGHDEKSWCWMCGGPGVMPRSAPHIMV
jgi:hypothetical protein